MVRNQAEIRPDQPLIDQAEIIKNVILEEQAAYMQPLASLDEKMIDRARQRFGIDEVDEFDTSDLIDVSVEKELLIRPDVLSAILPLTRESAETTRRGRQQFADILKGKDDRLAVFVRSCSVRVAEEALEYAREYAVPWMKEYADDLAVYGGWYDEKPRSAPKKGQPEEWKGLVFDPRRDRSYDMNLGLVLSRIGMLEMTKMGLGIGKERLTALTTQSQNGLTVVEVSGARSSGSPWVREYGAGASAIMAFKNLLNGDISTAAGAAAGAMRRHSFLGIEMDGRAAQIRASGNKLAYVILRGSEEGPNCDPDSVAEAKEQNEIWGIEDTLGIDFSHMNALKKAALQIEAAKMTLDQVARGEKSITNIWIESNLVGGRQDYDPEEEMTFGQSTTDECVDPSETKEMLDMAASSVRQRRKVGKKLKPGGSRDKILT